MQPQDQIEQASFFGCILIKIRNSCVLFYQDMLKRSSLEGKNANFKQKDEQYNFTPNGSPPAYFHSTNDVDIISLSAIKNQIITTLSSKSTLL